MTIFFSKVNRTSNSIDRLQDELNELGEKTDSIALKSDITHLLGTMSRMHANVSLALISERRLIGVLNVADKRSLEPFSSVEIDKIANAALAISAAFSNSNNVQRMKHQERLSAVGEMATGMAHEIRNPLGAIKSAAQLLTPSRHDPDSFTMLNIIIDEANRLDNVLSDFLLFARPSKAELSSLDVKDLLERIIRLVEAEITNVSFTLSLPDHLPLALGNRDQIHQVCLNLLRNSIQATSDNEGVVEIEVEVISEQLGGTLRERLSIAFVDHGAGIPDEDISKLFVPFFTTKQSGTGLGLPISQRLLAHHGSKINVLPNWAKELACLSISFSMKMVFDSLRRTNYYPQHG